MDPRQRDIVFYDGDCGLCHRWVRFLLAVDRRALFRFAPLGGETFVRSVPEDRRRGLPDSLVVLSADRVLRVRSSGVLYVLRRVGGVWRGVAGVFGLLPAGLLDAVYDWVARIRHKLFHRPAEACPLVPEPLRDRFLD